MMPDEPQFKWITASRPGRCQSCKQPVQINDRALWDVLSRDRIWCEPCALRDGFVDTKQTNNDREGKGSSGGSSSFTGGGATAVAPTTVVAPAREAVVMAECHTCLRKVPKAELTHVLRVGGTEVDVYICERCHWLYQAQWGLKINGMWRPTPKPTGGDKP